jgi:hypothetical protein
MLVPRQQGCTQHVLRFSHRVHDECRARAVRSLRPRNVAVPSYRPRQTTGETCHVLP